MTASLTANAALPPGDHRPSDRAGPRRVGLLSVHTSPLDPPGGGDSGGMNVYLSALSRHLAHDGIAVEIFTRATSTATGSIPLADGVTVHHIAAGPSDAGKNDLVSYLCAFALGVARHPALDRVEVLHGHYWLSGWAGRILRRRLGLPLVQTFHTLARQKNATLVSGDTPEPPLRVAGEERVVRDSDAIIVSTAAEAALLRDRYGALPGDVHIAAPGVDLELFRPGDPGDRLGRRPGWPSGGAQLLFVGRLQPLKGPDVAIRALAALDPLLPAGSARPHLLIVGGTSGNGVGVTDRDSLQALAQRLGVADRVEIRPPAPQAEVAALYRAADVVVMPSASETFGLVALEAQASGTPVVAQDVDGLRAVVAGGGTLVGTRDPRAWAGAIAPYLLDAERWRAASAAGMEQAAAHTWTRTATAVRAVYEHVEAASLSVSARGA